MGGKKSKPIDVGPIIASIAAQAARDREALTAMFTAQVKVMQEQLTALTALLAKPPSSSVQVPISLIERTGKSKEQLLREAQEKLGIDSVTRINIALAGVAGAGKSTLINAILGEEVAEVDMIECTMRPTPYEVPGTCLTLWDLPGWGTEAHPTKTYFMDKCLFAFDAMIVLYASRKPEGFAMIAEGCKEFGLQFAVARNKADIDIESLRGTPRSRVQRSHTEAVQELRRAVEKELAESGGVGTLFARKFLISAAHLEQGAGILDEAALLAFVQEAATTRAETSAAPAEAVGGAGSGGA